MAFLRKTAFLAAVSLLALACGGQKNAPKKPIDKTQAVKFDDAVFKRYIMQLYPEIDANGDQKISIEEAEKLETLALSFRGGMGKIKGIGGIEHFANLKTLDLRNQQIAYVDLGRLKRLRKIDLSHNRGLKKLVLGDQPALEMLWLEHMGAATASSIGLASAPLLGSLRLEGNSSFDQPLNLNKHPKIFDLRLSGASIREIDISRSPGIVYLRAKELPYRLKIHLTQKQLASYQAGRLRHWSIDPSKTLFAVRSQR